MKNRLFNAINLFIWGWKNPKTMAHFKILSDITLAILKVSEERRPYMFKIANVYPDKTNDEIVTVWCGAGMKSDPYDRIQELNTEIHFLKEEISELIIKYGNGITSTTPR